MRQFILLLFTLIITYRVQAQGNVIILEGNYQGKSLYVQNPFASGNVGFCVTEVKVNGNITTDEINSSAFEIDLKSHKLHIGDKVEIKVMYKDGCKPKVLNPEVLKPKSTFQVVEMSVDKEGTLKWETKSEMGKLTYVIEQFRWNKWMKIGEVEGVGTPGNNEYSFKIAPHSGKNMLRVRQTDFTGQPRVSQMIDFTSNAPEVEFAPAKLSKEKEITFSQKGKAGSSTETLFEIYDQYGNVVKKGFGAKVDVSNLQKGNYYINYDNKMGEFAKK